MSEQVIEKRPFDMATFKAQEENDLFYFVDNNTVTSERITAPRYSYWKSVLRIFFRKKSNWVILGLLLLILAMCYIFPLICPYDPYEQVSVLGSKHLSPGEAIAKYGFSLKWILGTGMDGNSIFYGIWASARTSLTLALICSAINMTLGIVVGAIWGYNKTVDAIANVIYNIVANVPYVLLISVLVYILGAGFWPFVFALTITGWLGIAYFIRTQVLIIRDREYNLASRCLGTPILRVVGKNILPYMISVIVTIVATEVPSYISMEVFLAYIGFSLGTEVYSLGQMINAGQTNWMTYPWIFWSPVAIASSITIILYVLGQNLADASDPRSHMQ